MERLRVSLRRVVVLVAVVAALVSCGGSALVSAQAASPGAVAADPGAPVAPEVEAKAAAGPVDVIAITSAPGDQVADQVLAAVPEVAAAAVDAGPSDQLALTVDADALEALRQAPYVERIVENGKNYISADTWAESIGVPATHAAGWDGSGESIAILDSGVQANHPYLAGKVIAEACFSSTGQPGITSLCPDGTSRQTGSGSGGPCPIAITECEHGTHVAGIAAGGPTTSGSHQLVGVAPGASLIAVQIFTEGTTTAACDGPAPCLFAYDSDLNDALDWLHSQVVAHAPGFANLAAVNLSLGGGLFSGPCDDDPTKSHIDDLASVGVITVAATGNSGFNSAASPGIAAPACISSAVSVGATTNVSTLASYTNLTNETTILAPGGPIISSLPGSTYGSLSGTSMSTPVISGAIALLKQRGLTSKAAIVSRLTTTGDQVSTAFGPKPEVELAAALLGVPNSPRDLVALPGVGTVDLSWSAPSFGGDAPLTGYTVTSSPTSAGCTTIGSTSCQVSGLVNGTTYTFTVRASGPGGAGSSASVMGTPRTVPGPPRQVSGVAGYQSVSASWIAPTSNGGAPVSGYRATAQPGGASCATTAALSCAISGLTNGTSYTVTVVARNAAGSGPSSSPSAPLVPRWAPNLPAGPPIGSLDSAVPGLHAITLSGWALDPEIQGPIQVHLYVDGQAAAVLADGSRPDVGSVFPRYGSQHGFSAVLGASGGPHTVCAFGIGVGVGGNAALGCRQVTVATGLPIGSLDDAAVGPGRVSVAGWSLDPDGADPIQVTVTIDDVPHTLVANGLRPDIDQALPGYGPRHGFAGSFGVSGGFHMVCAYGLDASTGTRSLLGCRGVVVPTGPPVGSVDQVTRSGSIVTVAGWALDPDTADPIDVHLVVGSQILPVHASIIRPDVGVAFPGYGSSHGFVATFSAASPVSVCAIAINIGGGSNTLLGCRAV